MGEMEKKVKVKTGGEARKIKVSAGGILKVIKHFTGEFKCLSYIDEDGDKVCCYKEEEAKMAVFEDGITTFNIVLENKDVGSSTKVTMI